MFKPRRCARTIRRDFGNLQAPAERPKRQMAESIKPPIPSESSPIAPNKTFRFMSFSIIKSEFLKNVSLLKYTSFKRQYVFQL